MFVEKYKTEKKKLAAVKKDGNAIKFIHNPSEKVQLAAIKRDISAIEYIHNPSESVIHYIIENCNDLSIVQSMRIDFDKLSDELKLLLEIKF